MRAVCAESKIQKTVELPQMPFDDDAVDVPVATWRRVVTSSRNWRGSRRESTTNLDSPLSTGGAFELIASRARISEQQCCAEIIVVHVAAHSRQMFSHHPWVRSGFVQVEWVRSLMQAGDREISHDGGVMVVAPLPGILQMVLAMTFEYDFPVHGTSEDFVEAGGSTRPILSLRSIANCPRSWYIDGRISTW